MTTTISKLKAATTKVVELPSLSADLRAAGQIEPDERVLVQVRQVRAAEVIAETGATPLLFSLVNERKPGESREAFNQRLQERLQDDPTALMELQRQNLATQEAIVVLGVTAIAIGPEGARPVWERLKLERDGDATVDILGSDFERVHDAVVEFSSLPYQRLGGAGTAAFPAQQAGAGGEPSGGGLRHDAERVPEPPAG